MPLSEKVCDRRPSIVSSNGQRMHNCKNLLTVVYCTHYCADTVTKRVTANFQSKYNGGFSWSHSFLHPYTS